MTGWSVDVLGVPDERDSRDVRCLDTAELARVVAVAAAISKAGTIVIRRDDVSPEPHPIAGRELLLAELDRIEQRTFMMPVATVRELLQSYDLVPDPIETGREAALAQWEERWAALRRVLASAEYVALLERIEQQYPTGLPVGERWIPRMTGRIDLQLEPERVTDLMTILDSITPEKIGSYDAAVAARELHDDLLAQIER